MMLPSKSVLNLFSIAVCGLAKIPQIKTNWKSKSIEGLSLASLVLENLSWSVSFCYFSYHGYPVLDYLEYPLLLIQSVILICFYLVLEKPAKYSKFEVVFFVCVYTTLIGVCSSKKFVSHQLIKTLMQASLPISPMSKVLQISTIIQTGRGDMISKIPWALYAVSSLARILTVSIETGDTILILSFSMSVFLNIAVISTAAIYNNKKIKKIE